MYSLNQRICALHVKTPNYRTKFLFYWLNRNKQLLRYDNGVDQTNLRKDQILNVKIPVIELEQQDHIINILSKFDLYCNDLSEGLPAEIKARNKQYCYYRDSLLAFKRKEV